MTNERESDKIVKLSRKDSEKVTSKKLKKVLKNLLTKRGRGDIIDKLTQKRERLKLDN